MNYRLLILSGGLALAGCGEAPAPAPKKESPASFPAGEWEVTTVTQDVRSTDGSTPSTVHKAGATSVAKLCGAPGPEPDPTRFTEKGDKCSADSAYARGGRLNIAYKCDRPGKGMVMTTIDGKYDSTSFEIATAVGSYFTGAGDYALEQRIKGKRLGDCPPATAAG